MQLHNCNQLNQNEQKELIKKITPYVAGSTQCEIKDGIKIGNKLVKGTYSQPSNSFTASSVQHLTTQTAPTTNMLADAIAAGTVLKNGNWYTYNNKNYLGKAKITAALSK